MLLIAPSVLSADFSNVEKAIQKISESGADLIHYDVMDGDFVPPITFGSQFIEQAQKKTKLDADVHLMISKPWKHFASFAKSGAKYLTFHYEAAVHHHRHLQEIQALGIKAGISIVPSTPVSVLSELLPFLDLILIMSVNPGYGGQSFLPFCLRKIQYLAENKEKNGYSYLISVDGGINEKTAVEARLAGADILVTGSSFFNSDHPADLISRLRK